MNLTLLHHYQMKTTIIILIYQFLMKITTLLVFVDQKNQTKIITLLVFVDQKNRTKIICIIHNYICYKYSL